MTSSQVWRRNWLGRLVAFLATKHWHSSFRPTITLIIIRPHESVSDNSLCFSFLLFSDHPHLPLPPFFHFLPPSGPSPFSTPYHPFATPSHSAPNFMSDPCVAAYNIILGIRYINTDTFKMLSTRVSVNHRLYLAVKLH